ncbi:MAG: DUF3800 domain-containing protein [Candidatus Bathyarchaeia archaeon]
MIKVMYLFYVDASGDPGQYIGTNSKFYILVGIGIPAQNRLKFESDFKQMLVEIFGEDIPDEIIARDIVYSKGKFSHLTNEQKNSLIEKPLDLLRANEAVAIAIVVKKEEYWERYAANPDMVRRWSMHLLLDRIDRMLEKKASPGLVIYDYEGKKDRLYRELLSELRKLGSIHYPSKNIRKIKNIIDTVLFTPSETSYGLQAADIVAYIIQSKYKAHSRGIKFFEKIKFILDKNPSTGEYLGWGLKEIP